MKIFSLVIFEFFNVRAFTPAFLNALSETFKKLMVEKADNGQFLLCKRYEFLEREI